MRWPIGGAETVVDIDFDPVRVDLIERPCRLASDRSTGMYRGKLRAVLDGTKLRGSREMLNGRGLVLDEQA